MKTYRSHALICAGTSCVSSGANKIKTGLEAELEKQGLSDEVRVVITGCNGFCIIGPIIIVYPEGIFYKKVRMDDLPELVEEHFLKGRPLQRLFFAEPDTAEIVPRMMDINFFNHQVLRALRNRGLIDPDSIDEYISKDGYQAIHKCLQMTPDEIIQVMKDSGLRGRGGGGFPAGLKWQFCKNSKSDRKFALCNADEGDPGAFMDRSILEADPHAVLEGMMIAGLAIGADQGYIYVRAEYPLAIERLNRAIRQATEYGLLGENIFGSEFSFHIGLYIGAGAFVCGEETALMHSIEGKRGMPRPRPPFPAHQGLWKQPSILNNVETYANVPQIMLNGASWFASLGTEKSKGTKVFSLSGAVNNIGLIEVPMGTSIRTIIYDIGGGIKHGRSFRSVQVGGPSGGFLPDSLIDLPVDYESINETGAIMGSGGMVVMDSTTCMVDGAKFFLEFTQDESCGKCTPCRVGTRVMLDMLERITEGKGRDGDIELLEELSHTICESSLCGLGQTAPNPVLTSIRYFREEYEEHIYRKQCRAIVCKEIISSPCQYNCPIHMDVPSWVTLVGWGKLDEAYELLSVTNPLPGICGRVCNHPCQSVCKRQELDQSISIKFLKRFISDWEKKNGHQRVTRYSGETKEKVAIIGSGPAGLTCAHYLALNGYRPTIYEELPVAGGMLYAGIPAYRLPREILNYEIDRIKARGVEVKLGTKFGRDVTFDGLRNEDFKAFFIATGAHESLKLGIEGEDVEGVYDCIRFLRKANFGEKVSLGNRVGVIGGGNAAIDAARMALRTGSEEVTILYRRTRKEMPADAAEVDAADHEGIKIDILTAPKRIISENGKLKAVECLRMELGAPDKSGRRRPIPIEGSEFLVELDALIPAISQQPDTSFLGEKHPFELSRWNSFVVNEETLQSNVEDVFCGGDAVTGPDTVIQAMAHGKLAAESIDQYLTSGKVERIYSVVEPHRFVEPLPVSEDDGQLKPAVMPEMDPVERVRVPEAEVELGFSEEAAAAEARRCLRCDMKK